MKIRIKIFLGISILFSLFFFNNKVQAKEIQFITSDNKEINVSINDSDNVLFYYYEEYRGNASYRTLYSAINFCKSDDFTTTLKSDNSIICKFLELGNYGVFEKKLRDLSSVTNIDLSSYISDYPSNFYIWSASQFDTFQLFSGKNWDRTPLYYTDVMNYQYYASKDFYDTETNELLFEGSIPIEVDSISFNTNYNSDEYVDIEVLYTLSNESNKVEYSLNGNDWYDYTDIIRFNINGYLIARIVDKDNNYIISSTLNINTLKYSEPTIKFLKTETDDIYAVYIKYYSNDLLDKYQYAYNGSIFSTLNGFNEITINPTINGYVVARILDKNNKLLVSATYNFNNVDVPDVTFIERIVEIVDEDLGKLNVTYLDIYVSNIKENYICTMATNDKKYKIVGNCENGLDQLISSETYNYNTNIYINIYSNYEDEIIVKQYEYTFFYKREILSIQDIIPFLQDYIDYNQDNLDNFKVILNDTYMYIPDEFRTLILFVIVIQLTFITILLGGK